MSRLAQQILFGLVLILSHILFGWQLTVVLISLGLGFLIDDHHVTIAFGIGLFLHGGGMAYQYLIYGPETVQMLNFIALISDLPIILFPLFTILIPASVYALAGFFSSNLFYIYQQLSH